MSSCTKFAVATAQFATADAEKRLLNIKHFADVIPHLASLPQVAQKERCKPFSYRRHTAQFCQSTMQCGMQCVQISSIFMIFCDKNNTTFAMLEILPKNNSKCFDLCIVCEIASFNITMIGLGNLFQKRHLWCCHSLSWMKMPSIVATVTVHKRER